MVNLGPMEPTLEMMMHKWNEAVRAAEIAKARFKDADEAQRAALALSRAAASAECSAFQDLENYRRSKGLIPTEVRT